MRAPAKQPAENDPATNVAVYPPPSHKRGTARQDSAPGMSEKLGGARARHTMLTDSSSSAERVLGLEGVTVLVYRGCYNCYPCCRTVSFVTVAVLDPVAACAQGCKIRDFVPQKNRREEELITPH